MAIACRAPKAWQRLELGQGEVEILGGGIHSFVQTGGKFLHSFSPVFCAYDRRSTGLSRWRKGHYLWRWVDTLLVFFSSNEALCKVLQ